MLASNHNFSIAINLCGSWLNVQDMKEHVLHWLGAGDNPASKPLFKRVSWKSQTRKLNYQNFRNVPAKNLCKSCQKLSIKRITQLLSSKLRKSRKFRTVFGLISIMKIPPDNGAVLCKLPPPCFVFSSFYIHISPFRLPTPLWFRQFGEGWR